MKSLIVVLSAFIASSLSSPLSDQLIINKQPQQQKQPELAPLLSSENAEIIPDEYIVMFKESSIQSIQDISAFVSQLVDSPDNILKVYEDGFAAKLSQERLSSIRARPEVDFVERNQVVSIYDVQMNPPSWGLPRIDQKKFVVKNQYVYPDSAGEGVDVYVIDTGVNIDHVDFEGRAVWGYTAPSGDGDVDGNGHGTHVAGTIAGKTYGVAKMANIIAVKVLRSSGSGTISDVIDGIQWAARAALSTGANSLANMSLGGGRSPSLDRAVKNAIASGLHFAVAAGNSNADACNSSPSGVAEAVSVGASTKEDTRAYFSNWGKCVDIFAPGHYITSAWIGSNTAKNTISGTSMASPHVAGVMALLLADNDYTPAELKATLEDISFKNVLSGVPTGTANRLLNNGITQNMLKKEEDVEIYF